MLLALLSIANTTCCRLAGYIAFPLPHCRIMSFYAITSRHDATPTEITAESSYESPAAVCHRRVKRERVARPVPAFDAQSHAVTTSLRLLRFRHTFHFLRLMVGLTAWGRLRRRIGRTYTFAGEYHT